MTEVTILDVLAFLRRAAGWALGLAVVLALLVFAASKALVKPTFTATATLSFSSTQLQGTASSGVSLVTNTDINEATFTAIAQSDAVIKAALKDAQGQTPGKSLKPENLEGTSAIVVTRNGGGAPVAASLTANADTPAAAATLATAWANAATSAANSLPRARLQAAINASQRGAGDASDALNAARAAYGAIASQSSLDSDQAANNQAIREASRLDGVIASTRQDLAVATTVTGQGNPAEAKVRLNQLTARQQELQTRISALTRRVAQETQALATASIHLDAMQSAADNAQAVLASARLQASVSTNPLSVLIPASLPEKAASSNLTLKVAAAFIIGLLIGLVVQGARELAAAQKSAKTTALA